MRFLRGLTRVAGQVHTPPDTLELAFWGLFGGYYRQIRKGTQALTLPTQMPRVNASHVKTLPTH
ncbi:MAG: hypothetical protein BM559_00785 [Roseobacter sp. MedPE-SWchi]|mgnify:CR=1 FL=1|nr:MAG: hypothetical protein BM559_00785 [Roseobacter sp. MedPE-SWchi]